MTVTQTTNQVIEPITHLQRQLGEHGNQEYATQIQDIVQRIEHGLTDVYVAFCGLFSAGKSSLINALVEHANLATGAVPTTAEVTTIRMETEHGSVVLLDTPGVDSTDAAHQAATEAALHKADVVVFVMDYQHVESEENMELARQFMERGKTLCLVVNQVDKHVEWELSFSEFQSRIERTFHDYGIEYSHIFYTSTKPNRASATPSTSSPSSTSAPLSGGDTTYGDITQLLRWLDQLAEHGFELVRDSILRTLEDIAKRHVSDMYEPRMQQVEEALYNTLGFVPFDDAEAKECCDQAVQSLDALSEKNQAEVRQLEQERETITEETRRLVDLAQIAPYETTEKGRLYIESLRPDFKIGWIGAKQKTEMEQIRRLSEFVSDLAERTEKFLVWPMHSKLREWLDQAAHANPDWKADIEQITASVTQPLCTETVHSGAIISEQYPYQYVKDVVSTVKGQVSAATRRVLEKWFTEERPAFTKEYESVEQEMDSFEQQIKALSMWLALREEQTQLASQLFQPVCQGFADMTGGQR